MAQRARPAGGVLVDERSWGVQSTSLPREHSRERGPPRRGHLRRDATLRATPLAGPSCSGQAGGRGQGGSKAKPEGPRRLARSHIGVRSEKHKPQATGVMRQRSDQLAMLRHSQEGTVSKEGRVGGGGGQQAMSTSSQMHLISVWQ